MFSPMETTATSTSWMPAARRARSSVASSFTVCDTWSASAPTRSSLPSMPITSCPSCDSVVAMAAPKRPSPMTAKVRLAM